MGPLRGTSGAEALQLRPGAAWEERREKGAGVEMGSREAVRDGAPLLEGIARTVGEVVEFLGVAATLAHFFPDPEGVPGQVVPEGAAGQQRGPEGEVRGQPPISQEVEISLPGRYAISGETRAAIDAIPGVVEVREI